MKYLTILEVSQKQAYIFESNQLKNNIENSNNICFATNSEYFKQKCKNTIYNEQNLVYSGGGHTVLEFDTIEQAKEFAKTISKSILEDFDGLEIFIKTIEYNFSKTPTENLDILAKELEKKKAIRKSAFHQNSFGIEAFDSETFKPKKISPKRNETIKTTPYIPKGYSLVTEFESLGGSKNETNFIAVVHIDGNAMGARIADLREKQELNTSWQNFKTISSKFSNEIDKHFKEAYSEMVDEVVYNIEKNNLSILNLKENNLPIREIIKAGDDICFVSEGRIGIECATIFLEKLNSKINSVDGKNYSACAGVAIVHTKFPFYRAYELAEALCSNAKKFVANLNNTNVSAIDWHINFGELKENISEIKDMYNTDDNKRLDLRPLVVCGENNNSIVQYFNFKKLTLEFQNPKASYARGKLKELRNVLKQGENSTKYYIQSKKLEDLMLNPLYGIFKPITTDEELKTKLEKTVFIKTSTTEDKERCLIFDSIEILDNYIAMERSAKNEG